ncbi:sugar phosphate isomerase/epimerase [Gilvimarinus sp. SDUM040013]|uniref:Sugar phosphate isomerase/epimerase n=1 Tax=Gilvimarinus gilvus TaxID=3058038 RepID=A0ABU4RZW0_9GAMM|nr:sugar phosphate isomerase/epimerase [Gilvimarinus sp. SDUM040013]MDO3384743.1 sugar phosphate isomerase/epimerase [Gilvimarinus sp. SDUM040013]MDX6850439.1 sugar phosphate isomerase/epimerase [Gilvimarinus sp. SDUM040013]
MISLARMTRRLVIGVLAVTAIMASTLVFAGDSAYRGISVQLWSVKDNVTEDVKGTLKSLADMGFDAVELAGNLGEFGDDAAGFKAYIDSLGLEISGAHVGFDKLTEENIDATIAFYKTLGVEWLIIPADGRAWSDEGIEKIVAQLNETAKILAPHGMKIGYHNHQDEFNDYADSSYWEYMIENTSDDVVIQLDISWAYFAGKDPVDLINRYGDRIRTAHMKAQVTQYDKVMPVIKEAAPGNWGEKMGIVFGELNKVTHADNGITSIVGQDLVDWQAVVEQFAKSPEPVWLVVEQEVYPEGMTPMQAVEASKKGLEKLL